MEGPSPWLHHLNPVSFLISVTVGGGGDAAHNTLNLYSRPTAPKVVIPPPKGAKRSHCLCAQHSALTSMDRRPRAECWRSEPGNRPM